MKNQIKTSSISALRQKVEDILQKKSSSSNNSEFNAGEILKLFNELNTYQIELEKQNEELQSEKIKAEITAEKYANLFDFAPSGYITLSREGKIMEINYRGVTLIGKERIDLLNNYFAYFISDETSPTFKLFFDEIFKSKKRQSCEIALSVNSHKNIYVFLSGIINDNHNECLITMFDISEHKKLEEETKINEEKYHNLFNANRDSITIFRLGKNGNPENFLEANPATTSLFGYTKKELLNMNVRDVEESSAKKRKARVDSLMANGRIDFETVIKNKNGNLRNVEVETLLIEYFNKPAVMNITRDITERKQTEENSRKAQENLATILEAIPDLLFEVNLEGKIFHSQAHREDLLAVPQNEFMGKSFQDILPPDVSKICMDALLESHRKGWSTGKQYSLDLPQGKHWFELSVSPIKDGNNIDKHFIILARDITDRKIAEINLVQNKQNLQSIFDSVSEAIYVIDETGTFIDVNKSAKRMYKYSRKELIGKSPSDVAAPGLNDLEEVKKITQKVSENGKSASFEFWAVRKNGEIFPKEVILNKGKYFGKDVLIATARDITEHKKAEIALQKSQEKLRGVFELANSGIVLTDLKGKYLLFNNWLIDNLGYKREKLNKLSREDITYPDDIEKSNRFFNEIIEGKIDRYQLEKRFLRKNGSYFWGEISVSAIKDKNNKTVNTIGIITDITERRNNEEKLKLSEARLIAAQAVAKVGSWETDLTYSNIIWSKENAKIFDLESDVDEITLEKFLKLVHPDDRTLVETTFVHSIKTNTINSLEHKIITPKGIEKIVEERWEILRDNKGIPYKAVGTCQDITERKLTENKLIENEYRLQTILSAEPECVKIVDAQGNLVSMNQAGLEIIEADSPDQVIGKPILNLIAPEYKKSFAEMHQRILKGESAKLEFEVIGLKGGRRWLETSAVPFQDGRNIVQLAITRDITDRKLTEEKLRTNKNILRAVLDNVPIGIWMMQSDGKMLFVNKVFCNSVGITEEQFIEVPHYVELYPPEIAEACIASDNEAFAREGFYVTNEKLYFTDGKIHDLEITKKKIIDEQNGTISLIGIMQDITERKIAEETLRESEEKYRGLVENSPDGIVIYIDDKIAFINDEGVRMLKAKSYKEIVGRHVFDFIHPDNLSSILQRMEEVVMDNNASATVEERFIDINGVPFDVEIKAIPTIYNHKPGVQVIVHDITESKRSQEKIRQLSQAVEQSPVTVVITNTEGEIEYVNPKFTETTGFSFEEVIGKNPRILKSDYTTPEEYKKLWNTLAQGDEWHGEFHNKKKDGSLYWESASISPIVNSQGKTTHYIAIKEDITNRKEIQKELIKAKEKAEESDRLKLAFLANMSHEIRTPMNGILGFTELLKEPKLSGEEQQEYINIIEKSGKRMLNIINDIISISKVESGQVEIVMTETNVNEQIDYIQTFFKPEAKQKGIQLQVSKQLSPKSTFIKTDREKLYAILTNLVKNALKFTSEGSIEFGCEIKDNKLEFFVKDTGLGISESQKKIIFERFRQANETISRTHEGSGLGLAISKAYVEMLGGKIWVESEEGKGSTFYFTLPYNSKSEFEKTVTLEKADTEIKEKNNIKNLKVLIVEDDAISKLLITIAIKPFSKEIIKVSTGLEAIETCRNNPDIDLVMMDINMPEMGGYEATRQIREFAKDLVIIAQTANGMQGDRENAIAAGCTDYISKPIDIKTLGKLIQKYFMK